MKWPSRTLLTSLRIWSGEKRNGENQILKTFVKMLKSVDGGALQRWTAQEHPRASALWPRAFAVISKPMTWRDMGCWHAAWWLRKSTDSWGQPGTDVAIHAMMETESKLLAPNDLLGFKSREPYCRRWTSSTNFLLFEKHLLHFYNH